MNAAFVNTASESLTQYRILVADDEPEIRESLRLALRSPGFVLDFAAGGDDVLDALARDEEPALVILDSATPDNDGITTLRKIRRHNRTVPVIMLSRLSSSANRREAMENGASDVLPKPLSQERLRQAIGGLLPASPLSLKSSAALPAEPKAPNLKGGTWVRSMEPLLRRVASCDVPVLIQGETGVGKEVLARYIHEQSLRSGRIFLKLNCAALPPELVESELFGYERGAFTGAFKSTPGKFELANGGTILLDEIGDMDLRLQAKLLQVLQDREFHAIGAKESTQVDVRVIAATHRQLETRIAQGQFREDLYYRLNVINIVIPPLRERLDEVIPLATALLQKHATAEAPIPDIGPALKNALLAHHWPGNIRELENMMRRYLVVRNAETLIGELQRLSRNRSSNNDPSPGSRRSSGAHVSTPPRFSSAADGSKASGVDSPADSQSPVPVTGSYSKRDDAETSDLVNLDQVRQAAETEVIMKTLYSTQWNRKRAAALLGVDYKALLYKMKKLGID